MATAREDLFQDTLLDLCRPGENSSAEHVTMEILRIADSPFGAGLTQPGGAAQMTQTLVELIYDRWPVFADYKALLFRKQLLLCIGQY